MTTDGETATAARSGRPEAAREPGPGGAGGAQSGSASRGRRGGRKGTCAEISA